MNDCLIRKIHSSRRTVNISILRGDCDGRRRTRTGELTTEFSCYDLQTEPSAEQDGVQIGELNDMLDEFVDNIG